MSPSEETSRLSCILPATGRHKSTIAKKLGVSAPTISNWAKKYTLMCRDVEAEKERRDYLLAFIFHCRDLALHKENMSIEDISERYGVPTSIIQKWVKGYLNGNDFGTTQQIIALANELADLREPMENVQREVKMRDLEVRVAIYEAKLSLSSGKSLMTQMVQEDIAMFIMSCASLENQSNFRTIPSEKL